MPVLGIIFLRHAANRFDVAAKQIDDDQASGKMPKRKILPADYIRRRALWLPEIARYDYIMAKATNDPAGLPALVTDAMNAIEADFEPLSGVLPKDYGIFEPKVLEELMRLFNSEQIKRATGDVFGRIYEYFLAKFSILSPDPLTVRSSVFTFLPYGSDNYFSSDKKAGGMDRTGRRANGRVPRPVHPLAPRTGARRRS